MAAPLQNLHAAKNGTRITRLIVGNLPKPLHRVQRFVLQYRRTLEDAVIEVRNEVGLIDAHVIDAACKHEQHAGVCRHLLRQKIETMSVADVRECSKQIATATDARNKAVRELQLERDESRIFDALYASPRLDDRSEGDVTDETASGERALEGDIGDETAERASVS